MLVFTLEYGVILFCFVTFSLYWKKFPCLNSVQKPCDKFNQHCFSLFLFCPQSVSHSSPFLHLVRSNLFTALSSPSSSPPSDESDYHTDYEEEALESALSDMELSNRGGDHTEGEETADTVRRL